MIDDKQKIKIHKLILEIEKKKKLISPKEIGAYIQSKKSEGITKLEDGTAINFSNVNEKVNERIDTKEASNNKDGVKILTKQNEFLDDILSRASKMRKAGYVLIGAILLAVWMVSAPDNKDESNAKPTTSTTYTEKTTEIVSNSPWDSGVYQVKDYLKKTLKDPDSYQSIEWYKVIKTSTGYKVLHKYRARNSFGGYMIETIEFILDSSGNVTSAREYK